jgi:hypothetical protein
VGDMASWVIHSTFSQRRQYPLRIGRATATGYVPHDWAVSPAGWPIRAIEYKLSIACRIINRK